MNPFKALWYMLFYRKAYSSIYYQECKGYIITRIPTGQVKTEQTVWAMGKNPMEVQENMKILVANEKGFHPKRYTAISARTLTRWEKKKK